MGAVTAFAGWKNNEDTHFQRSVWSMSCAVPFDSSGGFISKALCNCFGSFRGIHYIVYWLRGYVIVLLVAVIIIMKLRLRKRRSENKCVLVITLMLLDQFVQLLKKLCIYDRIVSISDLCQSCMSGSCALDLHGRRLQVPKNAKEKVAAALGDL